ncbi:serine/threonine-protein kinase TNNI3K-like [Coccinella septempunctata]|uniref:serine/threonine-protein kinase TNNI3K-like n=1 Tax=Coccinella septempunctata TaxID=41139 RepID=UPI001D065A14|nr:serine/threonine-protein kinase TNNI3K-like [Coccinella septempunctata]
MWWCQGGMFPYAALHEACLRQSLESVKNVVHSGKFNIDCENRRGNSALGVLAFELFTHTIRARRTEELNPKFLADGLEYEEKIKFLLKSGANPMKNCAGVTVAEILFRGENKNLINMVLRYIQDINTPLNIIGQTPLHFAIRKGFYKTAKNILAMKADIDLDSYCTLSPLHCAVLFQRPKFINLLIKHGVDMNTTNVLEETPLHIACYSSRERDIIHRLLQPNVHFEEKYLHYAMEDQYFSESTRKTVATPELVEFLLDKGFHLEKKDIRGLTPLHRCISRDIDTLALVFLRNDAHLEISTNAASELMEYISQISTETGEMSRIVLKFIALQISKGIPLNETLEQSLNELQEAKDYLNKCNEEIGNLKSYKIEDTNVTYWRLLAKSIKAIALCAENEIIIQHMKSFEVDSFPIYGADLKYKFSRGRKRQKTMARCGEALYRMCNGRLPILFVNMVIDRLSVADMENVHIAGQYI